MTNGHPNAKLLITQDWNPGGTGGAYNPHNVGVWYDAAAGKWAIFNEDRASMRRSGQLAAQRAAARPA